MLNTRTNQPIIFYDGSCPLCIKEIKHYQRLDKTGRIAWNDITTDDKTYVKHNISFEQAMKKLHAIDSSGNLVTGVDSFLLIWDNLPYYRFLGKIVRTLKLTLVLNAVYTHFAEWRFKRHCQDDCQIPSGKGPSNNVSRKNT